MPIFGNRAFFLTRSFQTFHQFPHIKFPKFSLGFTHVISGHIVFFWNKRKFLHKNRFQFPEDWFGTPTRPPLLCFGTPKWPPWRNVKTLLCLQLQVGTYRYMSPEELLAAVSLDSSETFKQMDIYSMALILWEVISQCEVAGEYISTF